METKVGDVTVRLAEPIMEVCLAEIVVVCPELTPVAIPVGLILAAPVFEEAQVTELVRSCVVLSEKVPVALN
jgi:hypothetical protein